MKELVVISGKGGTGKTSIVASFAALAAPVVLADCDVDAADLHLVMAPRILQRTSFQSGHEARIRAGDCTRCGVCQDYCRYGAISERAVRAASDPGSVPGSAAQDGDRRPSEESRPRGHAAEQVATELVVDPLACEGCGVCVHFCPVGAIDFPIRTCGEWYLSETHCGPMVHACLGPAEENSGRLVTLVRREAGRIAAEKGYPLVLIDGSPGIGCPVIASITAASFVLVVTEPTASARHDLERVLQLTRHFGIATGVCINKCDINPELTEEISQFCSRQQLPVLGRVAYDPAVTRAQLAGRSVVTDRGSLAARQIRETWELLRATMP